jgi:hypothetical protein
VHSLYCAGDLAASVDVETESALFNDRHQIRGARLASSRPKPVEHPVMSLAGKLLDSGVAFPDDGPV